MKYLFILLALFFGANLLASEKGMRVTMPVDVKSYLETANDEDDCTVVSVFPLITQNSNELKVGMHLEINLSEEEISFLRKMIIALSVKEKEEIQRNRELISSLNGKCKIFYSEFQEKNKKINKHLFMLQEKIKGLVNENQKKDKEIAELKESVDELREKLKAFAQRINVLEQSSSESKEQNKVMDDYIAELYSFIQNMSQEVSQKFIRRDNIRAETDRNVSLLWNETSELGRKLRMLSSQIALIDNKVTMIENRQSSNDESSVPPRGSCLTRNPSLDDFSHEES